MCRVIKCIVVTEKKIKKNKKRVSNSIIEDIVWDQGGRKNDGLEVIMKSITTLGPMVHGVLGRKTAII